MLRRSTAAGLRAPRLLAAARALSSLPSWATIDPVRLSGAHVGEGLNLVGGEWKRAAETEDVVDPLTGEVFLKMPATQSSEVQPFVESMAKCPKHGLHNPFKNVQRYALYGDVSSKAGALFREEQVADYFARLVQRVSPKSYEQARNEVRVTGHFLENFSHDQVRFLARSFAVPGDHLGQMSHGYRWPYGPVALITPFNFPIEIPVLQMMGALYMGNKVLMKVDSKVSIVMQETLRLLHHCGMPTTDVDFIHSDGKVMNELLLKVKPRNTLFTGYACFLLPDRFSGALCSHCTAMFYPAARPRLLRSLLSTSRAVSSSRMPVSTGRCDCLLPFPNVMNLVFTLPSTFPTDPWS